MANDTIPTHSAHLPVELIVRIGEFLAGDLCFGVLASLNVACRAVHEETQSVLYETIILRYSEYLIAILGSSTGIGSRSMALKYVRYVYECLGRMVSTLTSCI